jgi:hypothetical protein
MSIESRQGPVCRQLIELCGCGHANDHRGKPCRHPGVDGKECGCQEGARVDIATFNVVASQLIEISVSLAKLVALTEVATQLQARTVLKDGRMRVEVQQRQPKPGLILPG